MSYIIPIDPRTILLLLICSTGIVWGCNISEEDIVTRYIILHLIWWIYCPVCPPWILVDDVDADYDNIDSATGGLRSFRLICDMFYVAIICGCLWVNDYQLITLSPDPPLRGVCHIIIVFYITSRLLRQPFPAQTVSMSNCFSHQYC